LLFPNSLGRIVEYSEKEEDVVIPTHQHPCYGCYA